MRIRLVAGCSLVILSSVPAYSQTPETPGSEAVDIAPPALPQVAPAQAAPAETTVAAPVRKKRVYFGGNLGLTFGSYTRISVSPLIGYSLNPRVSLGGKGTYEYIRDSRYSPGLTTSDYGGSVFTRLRINPQAYAHAEFSYMNYGYHRVDSGSTRVWVPFLNLGGGVMKPLGPGTAAFVEVLLDFLQDPRSPYERWQPTVSFGVTTGF